MERKAGVFLGEGKRSRTRIRLETKWFQILESVSLHRLFRYTFSFRHHRSAEEKEKKKKRQRKDKDRVRKTKMKKKKTKIKKDEAKERKYFLEKKICLFRVFADRADKKGRKRNVTVGRDGRDRDESA